MGDIIDRWVFTRLGVLVGMASVRFAAVFLVLSLLAGCSLCSESERSQTVSPRGDRATVSVRDCGATTDFATAVQVRKFFTTEVVVMNGQPELRVKWSSDGTSLTITEKGSRLSEQGALKLLGYPDVIVNVKPR